MDESYYRRLATYNNFPVTSSMTKEELAWAGFVYTGEDDKVKCEFCGVQFHQWLGTDVAFSQHAHESPNCPFVLPRTKGPLSMDMRFLYDRRVSFSNPSRPWPHSPATAPSPTILADAGFYYTGDGDRVKCFHCGLVLHSWLASGMPYHAHARYMHGPCPYMIVEKGLEWIINIAGVSREELQRQAHLYADNDRAPVEEENMSSELMLADNNDDVDLNERLDVQSPTTTVTLTGRKVEPVYECEGASFESLRAEFEKLLSTQRCKVCLTNKCTIVYLPCTHLATCSECATRLVDCPICRKRATHVIEVFYT